ncbi:MAG: alkylhydroperoxidase [Gammaproteobacteria bacterium]|nr:alkylhydroperoxidase [Gammaproteobacteria bacterium]
MSEENHPICWIKTVPDSDVSGPLAAAYAQVCRGDETVHNLYKPFSLWPEALVPADALYRVLLHSDGCALERWFLELVSTYVAILTECEYAYTHHSANFESLQGEAGRAKQMLDALWDRRLDSAFDAKHAELLRYTEKLTLSPQSMSEADMQAMRAAGATDREILEVNQVCANFNYWVRVINGLGIELGDEKIGAC